MHSESLFALTAYLWLFGFFKTGLCHGDHGGSAKNLIVISFDGFRWDYLDLVKKHGLSTPNFDDLKKIGSSSGNEGVKNVFITRTFPNHYSIATGFYEESHGIVSNNFFDPLFDEVFDINNATSKNKKWWDGKSGGKPVEPVWVTNEKCNCKRKSGVISWPGSDVDGQRPSRLLAYNTSISFELRVDTLVDWFLEHEPINLGMLYFEEPDMMGHKYGPESREVAEKVVELDGVLKHLLNRLKEGELFHGMNIVITSDHGMVEQKDVIYLNDYLSPDTYKVFGSTPVINMLPNEGLEEEIYKNLSEAKNFIVYKKDEVPEDYHYSHNRRILPLVVGAPEGFTICIERNSNSCNIIKGNHGYNNSLPSMHPIFVSTGPAFKRGYQIRHQIETVDFYSLFCHVLGVEPHENEGNFQRISQVLRTNGKTLGEDLIFLGVTLVVVAIALTFCIGALINHLEFFVKNATRKQENFKEGQKHLLTSEEDDELV